MPEMMIRAIPQNLGQVNAFAEEVLAACSCPPRAAMHLMIALEELFINVASYAYGSEGGDVLVQADYCQRDDMFRLTLTDWGFPFNPFTRDDPDVTLPAQERPVGGLGILMVKKSMDVFAYERRDGQNVVTVGKKMSSSAGSSGPGRPRRKQEE